MKLKWTILCKRFLFYVVLVEWSSRYGFTNQGKTGSIQITVSTTANKAYSEIEGQTTDYTAFGLGQNAMAYSDAYIIEKPGKNWTVRHQILGLLSLRKSKNYHLKTIFCQPDLHGKILSLMDDHHILLRMWFVKLQTVELLVDFHVL